MIDLTFISRNFRDPLLAGMLAALVVLSAAPTATASTASLDSTSANRRAETKPDPALDPFLAGALGIVPFASGLYLSDRPARGVIFTAIDVMAALGVYTSKYTVAGDPDNVKNYFLLMAANNLLDTWVSTRYALRAREMHTMILPMPNGGFAGMLSWTF